MAMGDNVRVRGVVHDRSVYKKWSVANFVKVFARQVPYRNMQPKDREAALLEDAEILLPPVKKPKKEETGPANADE